MKRTEIHLISTPFTLRALVYLVDVFARGSARERSYLMSRGQGAAGRANNEDNTALDMKMEKVLT
jgi:hypothetical protein